MKGGWRCWLLSLFPSTTNTDALDQYSAWKWLKMLWFDDLWKRLISLQIHFPSFNKVDFSWWKILISSLEEVQVFRLKVQPKKKKTSSYVADFPPDSKLLRLRLRPEPAGHHAVVQRSGQQPAAARHRQDLPERERIRRVGKVRPHLQHAHPLPHLPLHRHAHHRLRSALRHHRHPQVRFWFLFPIFQRGFKSYKAVNIKI